MFMTGLTPTEHRAMSLTVELTGTLASIVADGAARTGDMRELVDHIHAIQHAVMANAAARAHPDMYRLLGGDRPPTCLGGR